MVIRGIKQVLHGTYEITDDAGPAFFLRTEYLDELDEQTLLEYPVSGEDVPDEAVRDILQAALAYSTEKAAMSYLARCEHCRHSLEQKLGAKQMEPDAIKKALDYLEARGYLSDRRFASAWLRTRLINHSEGRIKLQAELASRGVEKQAAREALDEFFADHDEAELCARAVEKYVRTHRQPNEEKMLTSLIRLGFSASTIKKARECS